MYGWLEVSGSLRTKKAFIPMNPMKILGWCGEMIGMTRNCLPKTLACSADIRKVTDDLFPYQVVACALWGYVLAISLGYVKFLLSSRL